MSVSLLLMFARKTQRLKGLAIAVKNVCAARVRFLKDRGSISRIFSMKMNRALNQNATTARITLKEVRALIPLDPPAGAESARACQYDVQTLARQCGCSVRRLEQVFRDLHRTPHNWLRERRLLSELQAIESLQVAGQLGSIKRMAIELGYRHPDNFIRVFKTVFDMSPKAFLVERQKVLRQFGIGR